MTSRASAPGRSPTWAPDGRSRAVAASRTYSWSAANPTTNSGNLDRLGDQRRGPGLPGLHRVHHGARRHRADRRRADRQQRRGHLPGARRAIRTTTTVVLIGRTDFAEAQSATQSGLASSTLTRQSAPLPNNICGTYGTPHHDHRDDDAGRHLGQLLPVHVHRDRQRRQHGHHQQHRQGRHHRPEHPDLGLRLVERTSTSAPALAQGLLPGDCTAAAASPITANSTGRGVRDRAATPSRAWAPDGRPRAPEPHARTPGPRRNPTTTTSARTLQDHERRRPAVGSSPAAYRMVADVTGPDRRGADRQRRRGQRRRLVELPADRGTTLTLSGRTDFTETQSSTLSGLASSTLTIQSAPLTNDTCGTLRGADPDRRAPRRRPSRRATATCSR